MWIEKHLKAISEKGSAGLVNDWLGGTNEIKVMIRFHQCYKITKYMYQ